MPQDKCAVIAYSQSPTTEFGGLEKGELVGENKKGRAKPALPSQRRREGGGGRGAGGGTGEKRRKG